LKNRRPRKNSPQVEGGPPYPRVPGSVEKDLKEREKKKRNDAGGKLIQPGVELVGTTKKGPGILAAKKISTPRFVRAKEARRSQKRDHCSNQGGKLVEGGGTVLRKPEGNDLASKRGKNILVREPTGGGGKDVVST